MDFGFGIAGGKSWLENGLEKMEMRLDLKVVMGFEMGHGIICVKEKGIRVWVGNQTGDESRVGIGFWWARRQWVGRRQKSGSPAPELEVGYGNEGRPPGREGGSGRSRVGLDSRSEVYKVEGWTWDRFGQVYGWVCLWLWGLLMEMGLDERGERRLGGRRRSGGDRV